MQELSDRKVFFPMRYDWIPGVWCLGTYLYEDDTISLMMYFENGRAKIFHTQDEAAAYAKRL